MERYIFENANPRRKSVGDCVIRAISKALGETWETIYIDICAQGFKMADMPSSNRVWGEYLRQRGFNRKTAEPNICVKMFCVEHDNGTYILGCDSHVLTVINGCYYDTWDSGEETVAYYWALSE